MLKNTCPPTQRAVMSGHMLAEDAGTRGSVGTRLAGKQGCGDTLLLFSAFGTQKSRLENGNVCENRDVNSAPCNRVSEWCRSGPWCRKPFGRWPVRSSQGAEAAAAFQMIYSDFACDVSTLRFPCQHSTGVICPRELALTSCQL